MVVRVHQPSSSPQERRSPAIGQKTFKVFTRLDRYMWRELWPVFWFGVGLFSTLGVAAGVLFDLLREVTQVRLPLPIALQILVLQIPYFVGLALPMAMLLATLLGFARLSGDGELTALKAAGITVYRLAWSVILMGLLVTAMMFGLNEGLVPATQVRARQLLEAPLTQGVASTQERNIFYQEYGANREVKRFFYAQRFDGKTMHELTVLDFTKPRANQVIKAESANWDPVANAWTFRNGTIYAVSPSGEQQQVLVFAAQQISIPRDPLDLVSRDREPEEMTIAEAQRYKRTIEQSGDQDRIRRVNIQLQRKYALPFTAVVFGLIGSVLGNRQRRLAASTGFGLSVLVVLGQYLLIFITNVWGKSGILSPWLAAWSPNLIVLGFGVILLMRLARK